jgi:type IV pilus assembly protein PilO
MNIDVKDPKFIRWLLAILVVVTVVTVYGMTTVVPFTYAARKAEIATLESRHQDLSRDLEKARLLVSNLERVEREYQILSQQWEVSQTLLPELNEMPNLLRKVTAAGQQSGIEFALFKPQPAQPRGFYADNPVEVKIQGGYHQTAVFLSRLANLNRIVNVSKLSLKGNDKQKDQPFALETSMTITAYTLGGAAAGEAAGPQLADSRPTKVKKGSGKPATENQAALKASVH